MTQEQEKFLCLQRDTALARAEKAEGALKKITKPEGVYSRDREKYFANIIEWCIETAQEALAATTSDLATETLELKKEDDGTLPRADRTAD